MKRALLSIAAAMTASLVSMQASVVHAETIRAVSGFGPSHIMATTAYPVLSEKLQEFTNGKWKVRDTPSGLLSVGEMNDGLKNGIAQMGTMVLPYFAADYVESTLVSELSIFGFDNRAVGSAVSEYIATCKECLAEFAANGQVYTGSDSTTTYELLTTKPIRTLADMKGLRIRSGGSLFTRYLSEMGAEPVQMPTSETFEGLSSGVLDGTYAATADLKNVRLVDVVKYVTNIHQGLFNAVAWPSVSVKLWDRMNNEERHALIRAAQYGQAAGSYGWIAALDASVAEGKKAGIEFIEADATLRQAAQEFQVSHLDNVVDTLTKRGVVNASEKVDRYLALVDKWHALVKDIKSPEELAELRYREIWANRDLNTLTAK